MIGMLGLTVAQFETFNVDHPAPACRFAEHKKLLQDSSWWKQVADLQAEQRKLLEELAAIPTRRYKFLVDEKNRGPRKLMEAFISDLLPAIRTLVNQVTRRAVPSVERFSRTRSDIQRCLRAGVVPFRTVDGHAR
jgi:hypothetical protein